MKHRKFRKLMRNKTALIGAVITIVFIFTGIFGKFLTPYDPLEQNLDLKKEGPSWKHPCGRDHLGRDIFSRILAGAGISLKVGFIVVFVSCLVGLLVGTAAGYFGGLFDEIIMRIIDILLAFPGILLAIAMVAVLGPNINNVIIALCIMGWVGFARLARGQALLIRELEYVEAARAMGAKPLRIIISHVIPNLTAPILVQATLGIAGAIIAEAGLSFLGLGVEPPAPSWGSLLDEGVAQILTSPHMTVFPGIAIALTVMGLNFVGDGLRDVLDPKQAD